MTSGGRIRLRLDAIRPAVLIEPVTSELSLEGELDQANRVGHERRATNASVCAEA